MSEVNPSLAFQLFKVAHEQFDQPLESLQPEQYQEAFRVAQRKIHIEKAVLSSPEAAMVMVAPAQVDAALSEIKQRYASENEFNGDMQRIGVDENFFYQALSRELYVEAVLDFISAGDNIVADTEVSLFYYMHLAKFKLPEIRMARHILVTINEDNPENTRALSQKKITQICNRLKKSPQRFEEQAIKHSECPTSLQGGLLGQVKAGVLYRELESILFQLKVGEISNVVESPLGFHVLRCDEIQQEGTLPLHEVQGKLKQQLENRKRKQKQRDWLEALLQDNKPAQATIY